MRHLRLVLALLVAGCGPEETPRDFVDAEGLLDAASDASASSDAASLDGAPDDAGDLDAPSLPPIRSCAYDSTSFGGAMLELDVGPTASERLTFTVRDLPEPSLVTRATLEFVSFDADHPGEEGSIRVNGSAPLDLPAMLAWDNVESPSSVDVTGTTVTGENRVSFGPGPLARSFFRIGSVRLVLEAHVTECVPPPIVDPRAVRRELHFHEATFTNRATWVVPCPPGDPRFVAIRDYAFTASGAEHEPTDCEGLYRGGSGERGTATFTFEGVVPSTYGVYLRFRTSANRNPRGALFIVNGEEQRIDQVDPSGDYREVLFGDRVLGGTVTIVLDSSREAESDSVTWVRLEPR